MSFLLPKPKSITADEVVLKLADWEEVVVTLEDLLEDAEDIAAVATARAVEARVAAELEAERGEPPEMTIPMEVLAAELDGAQPVRAWRAYRSWTTAELAAKSGVESAMIEQVEARLQTGSTETLRRLAQALRIPVDMLNEDDEEEIAEEKAR